MDGKLTDIVVVEDSPTQAEQVKFTLESHDFAVRVAGNGVRALELIEEKRPDVVISDVIMPQMDGYELCRRIKGDPALRRIPVILLTSLSDPRDIVRALECGADNFIVKPYDEHYLLSRIRYTMENIPIHEGAGTEPGVEIVLAGEKHFIASDRVSVLNLLFSSYEIAMRRNSELTKIQDELRSVNERLEQRVAERTAALSEELKKRKRMEDALKESEEQYRIIMETANDAIICIAPPGAIYLWNKKAEEIFGYSAQEVLGKDLYDIITSPEQRKKGHHGLRGFFATGVGPFIGKTMEVTAFNKEGREFPIELSLAAMHIGGEWHSVGIVRDISERKRQEQELRQVKNFLSDIVDSMPSLLVGICREEKVTQWNLEAQRVTGLSAAEAIGRPVAEVLPDFYPWIQTLRSQVQPRRSATMEKLLMNRNGERSFYDLMLYPLSTDPSAGAVVRIEDVTERARIQELMVQTEKMMSVGGLAAGMAHEINNPLGIIVQAVQNVERRLSSALPANRDIAGELGIDLEQVRGYLERRQIVQFLESIQEAAARAARIVSNMLQFSRQSSTTKQPEPLEQIMEKALELAANDYDLKKKYDFRSVEVVREYQPDVPPVPVVSVEIEQVLLNLLRNAAQAMMENPPEKKPRITLRLRTDGRYGVMEVEDNGPGIPEGLRRRVFEPFFTTKEPGVGTGLGLSVSYMIITSSHRGRLTVESTPGVGTCFVIRLPIEERQPTERDEE
ncbi:PAS domain S-box protein [Geomonas sp. RF6]|uniref:hybrid sensor histidine kinase/response regulator n=1 Tax=Geomonas sp. RF6 TaxID=2897342 RepID=UPI001E38A288|nr:PAS domain S-box protein [Geomonas sp. RF6]UFS69421.1 PAS domain S-box protein [Geomonas sp. RF6]